MLEKKKSYVFIYTHFVCKESEQNKLLGSVAGDGGGGVVGQPLWLVSEGRSYNVEACVLDLSRSPCVSCSLQSTHTLTDSS